MTTPRRAMLDADASASVDALVESIRPRRAAGPMPAAFTEDTRKVGLWRRSLAPLAVMAALTTVVGVGAASPAATVTSDPTVTAVDALRTADIISRSQQRAAIINVDEMTAETAKLAAEVAVSPEPSATPTPEPSPTPSTPEYPALAKVSGTQYSTSSGVNVRSIPTTSGDIVSTLKSGQSVQVTSATVGDWQQISLDGKAAWVAKRLLSAKKPSSSGFDSSMPAASGNYSTAACKYGSGIESGITGNTKRVFRAFCAVFPEITSYGGYRRAESWSYHTRGAAIDAMVSNRDLGWRMAKWAAANADALGIDQVIYAQRIWTKSNRTWRPMADRGSITANHYDHVHISVG